MKKNMRRMKVKLLIGLPLLSSPWYVRNKNFKSRDKPRDNSRSGPRAKVRNCYNCGDKNHFIANCHYEKREENGGRLIRKEKVKFSNKNLPTKNSNNFLNKKNPSRVLVVQEEYESGEDEVEEEPSRELVVAAIATTTPTPSLFDAPNENIVTNKHKCLMARAAEVSPKPQPHSISPMVCDENSLDVKLELVALDEFLTNMKGDTRKHFEAIMSQLGEAQELLEEKEKNECDAADEISALSQALEDEQGLRTALEV